MKPLKVVDVVSVPEQKKPGPRADEAPSAAVGASEETKTEVDYLGRVAPGRESGSGFLEIFSVRRAVMYREVGPGLPRERIEANGFGRRI